MKKYYTVLIVFFVFVSFTRAQQVADTLATLEQHFESFKYTDVIQTADSLLKNNPGFSKEKLLEIFRVKGISEYSLLEEANASKSFLEIIKIDSTFKLDSAQTSPKIIEFFNNVKAKYKSDQVKQRELQAGLDTLYIPQNARNLAAEEKLRSTMIRSLIMPGLGHMYIGEKTKGLLLTSLSAVSLGSMIYFFINTNKKENAYQTETNPDLMQVRFNDYNDSYKLRNASIIAFAVLWLYSQVDILFFTDFNGKADLQSQNIPRLKYDPFKGFRLSYDFSF